ncbi:hypothetical protein DLJ46_24210 [Micromonospora globispora]|uniref:Uncharacterized protein n=1 Tax=Micromonospora globispora TaxID=1450148 RepID=A0A317JVH2_9ACTN|nr:hypothetical protein [Micromonospora globispora]PWU44791.1 hypothetical protein DLJ46_24210 [Micromonospora globispora]RQW98646.1 hypothetical protein DKL51_10025 [Micromonospora globispora]
MTDLDQRIASVLRERAEGEIDSHRLLHRSRALGHRRQLRRRAAAGTALALVGVLGFVGVAGTDLGGLSGRLPWTAASPTVVAAPVPPRADGVPGAAQRPELVGTDPTVLHLAVDPAAARYLGWGVNVMGVESVRLDTRDGRAVTVELARSPELFQGLRVEGLDVNVREAARPVFDGSVRSVPGDLTTGGLMTWWQPAPGLYARAAVLGQDRAVLARAVAAVRFDQARRCAAPVRLTSLPEGVRLGGCSVDVTSFPATVNVDLMLYRGSTGTMSVRYRYANQIAGLRSDSNRTVGGRPAYRYPQEDTLELLGIPKTHLTAEFGWPGKGFTEADATTVLAGATVAKDPGRVETWH